MTRPFAIRDPWLRATLALLLLSVTVGARALDVSKSPGDHRQYQYLDLRYGMKVLLISDPATDKAAASLDVAVGSAADPRGREGLAHFLEHMLFLGTSKYPEPGEYQNFISTHGGSDNAYTGAENTNFHFDIDKDYLEPALDRFSQFFIAPQFSAEYVQREKNAVHSEYQANVKDDDRRMYSVLKQIVNPAHPLSQFAVGSLATLSDRDGHPIRAELIRFYETHYSADRMTLVVLGKEPLALLESWVFARFPLVAKRPAEPAALAVPLFKRGQLPLRVNVEPLRDDRQLELLFPLPPVTAHYRVKPIGYIASLLGHEGEGSLLSLLKARGWADQLAVGLGIDDRSAAAFSVSIELTERGLAHIEDITALLFQSLRLIEREGLAAWRYAEQAKLADLAFQFDEKDSPIRTVRGLASDLHSIEPADVLRARFMMVHYDKALIREYLQHLNPDNALLAVVARGLPANRRDPWYNTPYGVLPIPAATLERWRTEETDPALRLPEPNPFVPADTRIKPLEASATPRPIRIEHTPGFELWFEQDNTYRQPRADFYFSVRSPVANDTPAHAVLSELYTRVVSDELNEFAYSARLAGLHYRIYPHLRGITVRLAGYDDKLPLLLERVTAVLREPRIAADGFDRAKDGLIRELDNARRENPYQQTFAEVTKLLVKPSWSESHQLAAAKGMTVDKLRAFAKDLLTDVQVVALAHGNLHRNDAIALGSVLRRELVESARPASVPPARVIRLRAGKPYLRELPIEHPDSSVVVYFQGQEKSPGESARFEVLAQMLEAPFYHDLRTEKQLGYIVNVGGLPLLDVPGIVFLVQSPIATPAELNVQIDQFLGVFAQTIDAMSAQEFAHHKAGVLIRVLDAEERLKERTDRYWSELDLQHYGFDTRERLADAVHALTRQELRKFYSRALLGPDRRRLVVWNLGDNHDMRTAGLAPASPAITIAEPDEFADGKDFFVTPDPSANDPQSDYGAPADTSCTTAAAGLSC
ncbi:MAG: insulinase family protein [Chromatiales bacterium]